MEKPCKMLNVSDDTIIRAMKREGVPMRDRVIFCDKKNSNWKGRYSLRYTRNVAIRHFKRNECMMFGYKISTDVHH